MFCSLVGSTTNFPSIFSQTKWVTEADRSGWLKRGWFLFVAVAVPLPLSASPLPLLPFVALQLQPQGDVPLPRHIHSHKETCRFPPPRRDVPLYVVLCEFNEPHSQSFRVDAQVWSECVSILILSSIFKHCTNLKISLAGGASVIGNCAAQVNLWE
jgi:hypothetical protein